MHAPIEDMFVLAGLLEQLQASGGVATYLLLAAALALGVCGVPIPEEAVFAVGGALAAGGKASWWLVYLLGWSVVLAFDVALHGLGVRFGPRIQRSRLGRRVGSDRWAAMQRFIARRGVWAVVGARFVMGMRIPVFVLAGAMGMPRGRFLPAVALAGLVTAAVPLALGWWFGPYLESVLDALGAARWGLLVAASAGMVWWLVRRRA